MSHPVAAGMKVGRKGKLENGDAPLPFRPRTDVESERFKKFCERFVRVPKGTNAKGVFRPRPWQMDMVRDVLDSGARTVAFMLPRGSGKTTLNATIALYALYTFGEGANVVIVAVDERQATLAFTAARRIVELSDDLSSRTHIYRDRLHVPLTDSTFQVLPASPAALEGLDYVLALVDEAGVVNRDVFEVVQLAQGKRERSVLVAIGTPGPKLDDQVLLSLRDYARENPDDHTLRFREWSAAGFEHHPFDCWHCIELANPALDDFLHRDAMQALMPPKTREATWRRARLCQLATEQEGSFLAPGVWDGLSTGVGVPDGSRVVISLDGSFSDDTTALVVATVDAEPHLDVIQTWSKPPGDDDWRVPVLDVEQAIRDACKRWEVVEIVADAFRFNRTLQVLEQEKLPVVEFPWSPQRITAATGDLLNACNSGKLTHSGHPVLAAHVAAAVLKEDTRGVRIDKQSRSKHAPKIDCLAAALQAHSRATWRARKKRNRAVSFRR